MSGIPGEFVFTKGVHVKPVSTRVKPIQYGESTLVKAHRSAVAFAGNGKQACGHFRFRLRNAERFRCGELMNQDFVSAFIAEQVERTNRIFTDDGKHGDELPELTARAEVFHRRSTSLCKKFRPHDCSLCRNFRREICPKSPLYRAFSTPNFLCKFSGAENCGCYIRFSP